jgi:sialic acid synthase SpsE
MKNKVYIIAEIGSNHDGDINKALLMVQKAKEAGADAVKFQTFDTESLLNPLSFQKDKTEENWVYRELKKVQINEDFHQKILLEAQKSGIDFLSSPFDEKSLALVAGYCSRIKIASSEITNLPLLSEIGQYKKPVILSTGLSNLGEVEEAISSLISGGVTDLTLLHCVALYPLPPEEANLKVIRTLKECFGLPVGFSDHSLDDVLALAAIALGATMIEKHVTLKREDRIFDHGHSMEFGEFKEMVRRIREVESALGDGIKKIGAKELDIKIHSNKSFFTTQDLKKGDIITLENVKAVRPQIGIPVKYKAEIIGQKLNRDIKAHHPIFWEDIAW